MSKVYYRTNYTYNYITQTSTSAANTEATIINGSFIPYTYNNINYVGDSDYFGSAVVNSVRYYPSTLSLNYILSYNWYIRITSSSTMVANGTQSSLGGISSNIGTYGGHLCGLITGNSNIALSGITSFLITTRTISGKYKKIQDTVRANWIDATGYNIGGEAFDVNFSWNGTSGYKMILFSMQLMRLAFCTSYCNLRTYAYFGYTAVRDATNGYVEQSIASAATIDGDGVFDFGNTVQEIPDTFYQWLIANFEPVGDYTYILYDENGEVIETIGDAFSITSMTLTQVGEAMTLVLNFSTGMSKTIEFNVDIPEGYYFAGLSRTAGSSTIYIEPDTTSNAEISADTGFYVILLKYGDLPNVEFTINLLQNSAENNRVDKTDYLTAVTTLSGSLRHTTSVVNPTIIIDLSTDGATIPQFNYVYISAFNRYYFLKDLTSIRTGIWEMSLQCDVLMSYKDTILNQYALITRSSSNYNEYIQDSCQPMTVQKTLERKLATNTLQSSVNPMVNIIGNKPATYENYSYIVTCLSPVPTPYDAQTYVNKNSNDSMQTQAIASNISRYVVKSLMDYDNLNEFVNAMTDPGFWETIVQYFTNYDSSAVISIMAYPNDLLPIFNTIYAQYNNGNTMSAESSIRVFTTTFSDITNYQLTDNVLNQRIYAGSITFDGEYNSFLDYGNYTKYQLYLPCIGTVDLNVDVVLNKTVNIWYVIDWESGSCTAFLETTGTDGNPINIGMHKGQYGVPIAVISTDYARNKMNSVMATGFERISDGIGTASAIASGDLVGATVNEAYSMVNFVQNALGFFTTPAGVHATKSGTGIELQFMYNKPYAIISRAVPIDIDGYADIMGRPSGVYAQLSDLNGYTVVGMVHLQGFDTATVDEVEEVERLLTSGVMLSGDSTGYISPTSMSFTGAVGADSTTDVVQLFDSEGNSRTISQIVLNDSELVNNISIEYMGSAARITCNFIEIADGSYTAIVYDKYNNKYTLTINLSIAGELELAQSAVYFDNVTSTKTETIEYSGYISTITNPDTAHISTSWDNSTGVLTITYTNPDSESASLTSLSINGYSNSVNLSVYCVYPLTVDPDTVYFGNTLANSYDAYIECTSSGSDLDGGGFDIEEDRYYKSLVSETDNKTYISIVYTGGTLSAGTYTVTLTDIYLDTTKTVYIYIGDALELSETELTFSDTETTQTVTTNNQIASAKASDTSVLSVTYSSTSINITCNTLTAGTYTVTVTDIYGQTATITVTVEEAESLTLSANSLTFEGGVATGTSQTIIYTGIINSITTSSSYESFFNVTYDNAEKILTVTTLKTWQSGFNITYTITGTNNTVSLIVYGEIAPIE